MKQAFALLLCFCMLIPLASCSASLENPASRTEETAPETKPAAQKQEDPYAITKDPISLPEGNTVGVARVDITPERYPIYISSGMTAERALDPLYFTCVAISDGQNVALLISADLKRVSDDFLTRCIEGITEATGVPAEYIFLNATHNHNAPSISSGEVNCLKWHALCTKRLKWVCREAMMDLAPAKAFMGRADTTGFAFVRRYLCEDGSHDGLHHAVSTGSPAISHETEADPTLQTIRFQREGEKKDIVMVNWQAHVAHAATSVKNAITADFVHNLRTDFEKAHPDTILSYYNGASGNLNLSTRFPEKKAVDGGYQEVGKALALKVEEAIASETEAKLGPVKAVASTVTATVRTVSPQRVVEAQQCASASGTAQTALLSEYGFQSKYEATAIIAISKSPREQALPVSAIACGDLSFAANACEMFDTNGMEVKGGSPFAMTFMCAYTNGQNGYIPSAYSYPRGGYEVDVTRFVQGTGEALAGELIRLLNLLSQ